MLTEQKQQEAQTLNFSSESALLCETSIISARGLSTQASRFPELTYPDVLWKLHSELRSRATFSLSDDLPRISTNPKQRGSKKGVNAGSTRQAHCTPLGLVLPLLQGTLLQVLSQAGMTVDEDHV